MNLGVWWEHALGQSLNHRPWEVEVLGVLVLFGELGGRTSTLRSVSFVMDFREGIVGRMSGFDLRL